MLNGSLTAKCLAVEHRNIFKQLNWALLNCNTPLTEDFTDDEDFHKQFL